jgi:hypothetical protein
MAHLTQYGLIVILATFRSHRRAGFLGQCDRFVGLCLRPGCMDDTYLTKPFSTYGRSSDRNTVRALDHVRDADSLRTSPVPLHPVWPKAGCTLLGTYPTSLSALAIMYSKGCRARRDRTKLPGPEPVAKSGPVQGIYSNTVQKVFIRSSTPASDRHASRAEPECSRQQARRA